MSKPTGIVYDRWDKGHRTAYARLFQTTLGLQPVFGAGHVSQLLSVSQLLCSTVDDYLLLFAWISFARAVLGRPTVGLGIRIETAVQSFTWKRWLKGRVFCFLNRLPRVRIVTLRPFRADDRLARFARLWIYDPQFWDVPFLKPSGEPTPLTTDIRRKIAEAAAGRKIVMSLGHQSHIKGVDFMMELTPGLNSQFLFCCIGPRWDFSDDEVARFRAAGGLWFETFPSEDELISFYDIADFVWCCYAPDYDQSSGIFGRALQKNHATLVREGSFVQIMQKQMGFGVSLIFGDVAGSAARLRAPVADSRAAGYNPKAVGDEMLNRLKEALNE